MKALCAVTERYHQLDQMVNGLSGTVTLTYDVALKESAKEAGTYDRPAERRMRR